MKCISKEYNKEGMKRTLIMPKTGNVLTQRKKGQLTSKTKDMISKQKSPNIYKMYTIQTKKHMANLGEK